MSFIEEYIKQVQKLYQTERAREHAYRPAFEKLIRSLSPDLTVLNDPARTEFGAPDFIFLNKAGFTIGYTETKDVGVDLDKVEKSEQMQRYFGYSNLILTDYLEFRFFRNGEKYGENIKIAEVSNGQIAIRERGFTELENTIKDFLSASPEKIKSGQKLAKIMGGKARRIRDNAVRFLDDSSEKSNELRKMYDVVKKLLIHDLSKEKFSDMYAQTLVYGLFIARYNDSTPDNFTRQEARDLVPASNPFLRHFFDHIVGADFDKRLEYIVNELCEVFSLTNIKEIMGEYLKDVDPVIHFYEDFLKEYDYKLRAELGVFYTPAPVVNFIVRSVDEILQKEFDLPKGLADTSKIEVERLQQGKKIKEQFHRVQILDPAVGTGTFLNQVIRVINEKFQGQEGRWKTYVNDDLLPRLHGFEIMMASYVIAHLKLSMTLKESGYSDFSKRLGVYLTNSLEEPHTFGDDLFSQFGLMETITDEAKKASEIKTERPIMVVIGNPPYSGHSANKGIFEKEINDYKKEFDGRKLKERNPKWLNDDYVKFIRFGESMIEKRGEGVLAFITNHAYLDNPTFRGMRYHLLQTFDSIYIIDLHGNTKKKEAAPDGGLDQNVFDIQQGVSIIVAVKTGKKKKNDLADLYRKDIFGKRENKFEELNLTNLNKNQFDKTELNEPSFVFKKVNSVLQKEYQQGFSVADLFKQNSVGIVTAKDAVFIADSKYDLKKQVEAYLEDKKINKDFDEDKIKPISYRPLDDKFVYYDTDLLERSREKIMKNFNKQNLGLVSVRQVKAGDDYCHILVSDKIVESTFISNKTSEIGYVFPLYLYFDDDSKEVNFDKEIYNKIVANIKDKITPENILDYIYAYLYSPSYREKYREFLKTDFPRIPYPKDEKQFFALARIGEELRSLHLFKGSKVNDFITKYPVDGDNTVSKVEYTDDRVYINETQYFSGIPESVWNFYIGCYRPAYKWVDSRKGKKLSNEDIEHYQEMIVVLQGTIKMMKMINSIIMSN